jgi:hypothetical protein
VTRSVESNGNTVLTGTTTRRERIKDYLGLERNVVAASSAVFPLGMGEELWKKFLPKYLESLGAGTLTIGLFGTAKDFFDALYQYPGDWLYDYRGLYGCELF